MGKSLDHAHMEDVAAATSRHMRQPCRRPASKAKQNRGGGEPTYSLTLGTHCFWRTANRRALSVLLLMEQESAAVLLLPL